LKSKSSKSKRQIKKIVNNKTVHVEIPGSIHKKLRALLFLNEMSMQKFFCLMAEKYIEKDNHIHSLVDERVNEIKDNKLSKLRDIEEKDLYNVIEENSPFK
jgi:hypothetical protein